MSAADATATATPARAARIAPGSRREVGLFAWVVAHGAGRVGGTTPPNLFLTLGKHRRAFFGWIQFAGRLMPRGRLPRLDTELVILRVAHLRGCAYEFDHHVALGARVGVTPAMVERIVGPSGPPGGPPRHAALISAVDQLVTGRDVDDDTWADLRRHLSESDAIELVLLAAHYDLLATTIGTLGIHRLGLFLALSAAFWSAICIVISGPFWTRGWPEWWGWWLNLPIWS